jgi:hypothetical protein
MAIEHRQQHCHPIGVQPLGDAPRRPEAHAVDQRLQFNEQRPAAFARDGDDAAGSGLRGAREKDRGRIADLLEPLRRHRKEPELVGGTKAVLRGPHDAKTAAGIAFEIEHGVHEMLEHARPRNGALFRHVADQHHGGAGRLRVAHQLRRALPQLRDRTDPRIQPGELHGLDGIHDQQRRLAPAGESQDRFEVVLGHYTEAIGGQSEPLSPGRDLIDRLFSGGVQDASGGGHMGGYLQQQRRFADTRIPSEQRDRTGDNAATQHPIELALPAANPCCQRGGQAA